MVDEAFPQDQWAEMPEHPADTATGAPESSRAYRSQAYETEVQAYKAEGVGDTEAAASHHEAALRLGDQAMAAGTRENIEEAVMREPKELGDFITRIEARNNSWAETVIRKTGEWDGVVADNPVINTFRQQYERGDWTARGLAVREIKMEEDFSKAIEAEKAIDDEPLEEIVRGGYSGVLDRLRNRHGILARDSLNGDSTNPAFYGLKDQFDTLLKEDGVSDEKIAGFYRSAAKTMTSDVYMSNALGSKIILDEIRAGKDTPEPEPTPPGGTAAEQLADKNEPDQLATVHQLNAVRPPEHEQWQQAA